MVGEPDGALHPRLWQLGGPLGGGHSMVMPSSESCGCGQLSTACDVAAVSGSVAQAEAVDRRNATVRKMLFMMGTLSLVRRRPSAAHYSKVRRSASRLARRIALRRRSRHEVKP